MKTEFKEIPKVLNILNQKVNQFLRLFVNEELIFEKKTIAKILRFININRDKLKITHNTSGWDGSAGSIIIEVNNYHKTSLTFDYEQDENSYKFFYKTIVITNSKEKKEETFYIKYSCNKKPLTSLIRKCIEIKKIEEMKNKISILQ